MRAHVSDFWSAYRRAVNLELRYIVDGILLIIPAQDPVSFKVFVRRKGMSRPLFVGINLFWVELANIGGDARRTARHLRP